MPELQLRARDRGGEVQPSLSAVNAVRLSQLRAHALELCQKNWRSRPCSGPRRKDAVTATIWPIPASAAGSRSPRGTS
jgi:hypothetical protein